MNIAVLGTGMVGDCIATKLVSLGHDVCVGARTRSNERAAAWAAGLGARARHGSFSDAATFGELVFNCTRGATSIEALQAAGSANLAGKILIDVANPLEPESGGAPGSERPQGSLGERIQRAFPATKVVKTLNTVNCRVMVEPALIPGEHELFISGDDAEAKALVRRRLEEWFGWRSFVDLGGIETARASEAHLTLWLALYRAFGTADFNVKIVRTHHG